MDTDPIKILLIEDDPTDAGLIKKLLSPSEDPIFHIEHADNLSAGTALLSEEEFDVLLLDLSLPDSPQEHTLEWMKGQNMPVVILTANDDRNLITQALQSGAQDYLIKSTFHKNLLRHCLIYARERWQANNQIVSNLMRADKEKLQYFKYAIENSSQALKKATLFTESILNTIDDIFYAFDRNGNLLKWNMAVKRVTGYNDQELATKKVTDFFSKADLPHVTEAIKKAYRDGRMRVEAFFTVKNGNPLLYEFTGSVLKERGGEILGICGTGRDITQRKQLEEAFKSSEAKYKILVENIPQKIFLKDKNFVYVSCNENYARDLKIGSDQISGKSDYDFFPKELADKYRADDHRIMGSEKVEEIEEEYLQDQKKIVVQTIKSPVKDEKGNIVGLLGIFWDITERKKAEQETIETAQRFSSVINSVGDGITFSNDQGKFFIYNSRMEQITGYSMDEANNFDDFTLLLYPEAPERHKALENLAKVSQQGFCEEFETTIQVKDGSKKNLSVSTRKIKYQDSIMFLSVYRDVTERQKADVEIKEANKKLKRNELALRNMLVDLNKSHKELLSAQSQLVQSEKLASLGQLSAGVAHEINNPLGFIDNNIVMLEEYTKSYLEILQAVEVLKKTVQDKDLDKAVSVVENIKDLEEKLNLNFITNDIEKLIQQSKTGTDRIKKIVQDLKTFARKDEGQMELNSIEEILDGITNIVWNEIKYTTELKKEYGKIPLVQCNAQKLGQVFINLLVNAAQAIKEKGEIRIKTYQENDYACIAISDTGCGIPQKNMDKIFDPFFTTKEVGKGTGLGLSIGYDIIKQHKGEMEVFSEVGQGTKFVIKLPLNAGEPNNG